MKRDGIIPNNNRNIIIRDNEKETCTLIDVAVQETDMRLRRKP